MMRKTRVFAATAAVGLALAGCSINKPATTTTAGGSAAHRCQGAKIAYITPGLNIPFWRSMSAGIKQGAEAKGAKVTDYDSKLSQSTQLQNVQDAITAGADAIVISPTDSSSAPVALKAAADAHIPVVIADIGTVSGDYVTFVKTDNVGGARQAGEYMAKQLKAKGETGAQIGIIGIAQSRQNGKDRTKGFSDAVKAEGYSLLPLLESKDYTRSEGVALAQDLLTGHPEMKGIFTEHDEASQGTLTALDSAKKAGKVIVVGFDGSPDTLAAIQDKRMAGAAMQQPVTMGSKAFGAACAHLDGTATEKEILVDTIMVTQDNVAQVAAEVQNKVFAK